MPRIEAVTEGRDGENLSRPVKRAVENLAKCVNLAQPSVVIMTDVRTICCVDFEVGKCALGATGVQEHRPGPPRHITSCGRWKYRRFRCMCLPLRGATAFELPQSGLELGGALMSNRTEWCAQVSTDMNPSASTLSVVHRLLSLLITPN